MPHLAEERCYRCLSTVRELMAEAEPSLREGLGRLALPEELSDEEDESLTIVLRQTDRRASVLQAERALAPELLTEIEARGPDARRDAIRLIPRYQLLGLVQHLVEESRREVFSDLARALELAELAVVTSGALDPRIYSAAIIADMRALSRACLGNARRVASDLHGAEAVFQDSLTFLQWGNPVSPVRADVWSLLGSLRIDQGRYIEAKTVLGDALRELERSGLEPERTKVRIKLANAHAYAADPGRAVLILQETIDDFTDEIDESLQCQAHHNLTSYLIDAGEPMEALARYEKARPLYEKHFQAPSLQMRRRWLEGRIYAALGDRDLARTAFEEVRTQAIEREQSYELAMVSLELALIHLHEGDTHRVQKLADEMNLIFRSNDLHRHALCAMGIFHWTARNDTATVGLVEATLTYLRRARTTPTCASTPPHADGEPRASQKPPSTPPSH